WIQPGPKTDLDVLTQACAWLASQRLYKLIRKSAFGLATFSSLEPSGGKAARTPCRMFLYFSNFFRCHASRSRKLRRALGFPVSDSVNIALALKPVKHLLTFSERLGRRRERTSKTRLALAPDMTRNLHAGLEK
ncbi:hypothetical protein, partial [Deinococcus petrolearius]